MVESVNIRLTAEGALWEIIATGDVDDDEKAVADALVAVGEERLSAGRGGSSGCAEDGRERRLRYKRVNF